jgi:hypothetical protein
MPGRWRRRSRALLSPGRRLPIRPNRRRQRPRRGAQASRLGSEPNRSPRRLWAESRQVAGKPSVDGVEGLRRGDGLVGIPCCDVGPLLSSPGVNANQKCRFVRKVEMSLGGRHVGSKPLAKRALHCAVASERLAVGSAGMVRTKLKELAESYNVTRAIISRLGDWP